MRVLLTFVKKNWSLACLAPAFAFSPPTMLAFVHVFSMPRLPIPVTLPSSASSATLASSTWSPYHPTCLPDRSSGLQVWPQHRSQGSLPDTCCRWDSCHMLLHTSYLSCGEPVMLILLPMMTANISATLLCISTSRELIHYTRTFVGRYYYYYTHFLQRGTWDTVKLRPHISVGFEPGWLTLPCHIFLRVIIWLYPPLYTRP